MAFITVTAARALVKHVAKAGFMGEEVSPMKLHAAIKALDGLGDGDGKLELSDIITATSDYISDIGERIAHFAEVAPSTMESILNTGSSAFISAGEFVSDLPDLVHNVADGAGDFVSDIFEGIADFLGDLF